MNFIESLRDSLDGDKGTPIKIGAYAFIGSIVFLALLLLVLTINAIKATEYVGKSPIYPSSIPVIGKGEVLAIPDVAQFSFSIIETGTTVSEAQTKASEKNNKAIEYLKESGVEAKDIETISYSINPRQDYSSSCINGRCGPPRVVDYEVVQMVSVKVRDGEKAGEILGGVGSLGVSAANSLTFTVDDEDLLKREARDLAIADAQEQAEKLAEKLGVNLGEIISYYEMEYPVYPMYDGAMRESASMMKVGSAVPPQLEPGEQKITSQVTISYEIK